MAVVTADRRPAADRTAFRAAMATLRLAELREGVWLRPANLVRPRDPTVVEQCVFFDAEPEDDPVALAESLWDLRGWARRARTLTSALGRTTDPAEGFVLSAAVLRHLVADPVLPPELLPPDWPGPELRHEYERFDVAYRALLREHTRD